MPPIWIATKTTRRTGFTSALETASVISTSSVGQVHLTGTDTRDTIATQVGTIMTSQLLLAMSAGYTKFQRAVPRAHFMSLHVTLRGMFSKAPS